MPREGRRRLRQSLGRVLEDKADRLRLFPALLGAYVNGQKTLRVAGRTDFVWTRLRGGTSEVIQAINEVTAYHWDLPVLVYRDPNAPDVWKVYGRDARAYSDWEGASYLPPHADSHSFANASRTGSDVVWVQKRQYMPLLPRPVATGTMGVYLEPDFYYFGGAYHWWPGSGTVDMSSHKPTGANNGRFVTVYISGSSGVLAFVDGPEFDAIFPPGDPGAYISLPSTSDGIPVVAVFLLTGSQRIGWGELYDLRLPNQALSPVAGVSGSVVVRDEGSLLGAATTLNFVGPGVLASISGSYATVTVPGPGTDQIGLFGLDDGVPLGTGTSMDAGYGVDLSLSGTRLHIRAEPPITGSVEVWDEATPLGSARILDFVGPGVSVTLSGSYASVSIPGGGGSSTGIDVWEEGVPKAASGTVLNFGPGFDISASGTVVAVNLENVVGNQLTLVQKAHVPSGSFVKSILFDSIPQWGETLVLMGQVSTDDATKAGNVNVYVNGNSGAVYDVLLFSVTRALTSTPEFTGTADNRWLLAAGVPSDSFIGASNELTLHRYAEVGKKMIVNLAGSESDQPGSGTLYIRNRVGRYHGDEPVTSLRLYPQTAAALFAAPTDLGLYIIGTGTVGGIGGSSGAALSTGTVVVADEGAVLGSASLLNFEGAGVTVVMSGAYATATIPGGGGGGGGGAGIFGLEEGIPLATGTSLDAGPGLRMGISGSRLRLDGGYFAQDIQPFPSGSALDWHFEGGLGPWRLTGGVQPPAPYDVDSSWPSHFHTQLSGTQSALLEARSGLLDSSSGSISVTAAFVASFPSTANPNVAITFEDDDASDLMTLLYVRGGAEPPAIRLDKKVAGASTFNINARSLYFHSRVYLHLERVGTSQWGGAISYDGYGWFPITALHTQAFGVQFTRVALTMAAVSSIFSKAPFGLDWVKVNQLFLFS